jgi:hypothetical protein
MINDNVTQYLKKYILPGGGFTVILFIGILYDILGFWIMNIINAAIIGAVVYLLYRLVVAVEELAGNAS